MKLVDAGTSRAAALRQTDVALGTVTDNRILTAPGAPAKRHIEFELPEGMIYQPGDYLAVLPVNPDASVRRVLAHFGISREQEVEPAC
jgi:cytochrome P450/NADPH-cytochrome P450 reductase